MTFQIAEKSHMYLNLCMLAFKVDFRGGTVIPKKGDVVRLEDWDDIIGDDVIGVVLDYIEKEMVLLLESAFFCDIDKIYFNHRFYPIRKNQIVFLGRKDALKRLLLSKEALSN